MDEYVYYWKEHDVYCYRDELVDFIDAYGHNYSSHRSDEFFNEIWVDTDEDIEIDHSNPLY